MEKLLNILRSNSINVTKKQLQSRTSTSYPKKMISYDVEKIINMSHYIIKTKGNQKNIT